jgi:hypothetical protein
VPYKLVNGRLRTRSLEVHVTDHCNLRCRQCCSLSPYLAPWCLDPADLERDLLLARRALAPTYFKLVGGEPLLHPRLLDCLDVAHAARIAPIISVTTNGLLLHKMPDAFWERLHHLTLSVYPTGGLTEAQVQAAWDKAEAFGVTLNLKRQDQFQEFTPAQPHTEATTRAVFGACWLRHRCHMIRDGRFFLCTKPPHLDTYHRGATAYAAADGVRLHDGPGLAEELRAYLERAEPLESCRRCWGGSGALFDHRQLTRTELAAGV